MPRPKNLKNLRPHSTRLDDDDRDRVEALRLEGETDSDVIRRVLREFAAAVLP